jgi:NAD(P)H-hydrate repair Nnr-like enzyme with NAD(P)H-hydrate dehydratase domain
MFTRLITRGKMTAASVAYLLVIVATTGTAFGGSAGSMQAGVGSVDACSLLTAADVQAATKRPVRPPAKSVVANLATCTFDDPKDPTSQVVNLNVLVSANAADAKKALAIAKSNAADVQSVAGLGEDAYWDKYLRALRIVKGRYELDLVLDSEAGGLDAAKALAAKALSRLPA